jgi:hypothetical protein
MREYQTLAAGGEISVRKSWKEKLSDDKDLPKVVRITEKMSHPWGRGTIVVPAPREVDAIMKKSRKGS